MIHKGDNLFYRWFGMGKIPKKLRPQLEKEGIVFAEEGIGGSVTLKNFRAPGRWHSWKRSGFVGSLVWTRERFWGFSYFQPIVSVPVRGEEMAALSCEVRDNGQLAIHYDAARFNPDWQGWVECRFSSTLAQRFLAQLLTNGASRHTPINGR